MHKGDGTLGDFPYPLRTTVICWVAGGVAFDGQNRIRLMNYHSVLYTEIYSRMLNRQLYEVYS